MPRFFLFLSLALRRAIEYDDVAYMKNLDSIPRTIDNSRSF